MFDKVSHRERNQFTLFLVLISIVISFKTSFDSTDHTDIDKTMHTNDY